MTTHHGRGCCARWLQLTLTVLFTYTWPGVVGAQDAQPLIVGYLPEWALPRYDLSEAEGVTDVIFFSITPGVDGSLSHSLTFAQALRNVRTFTHNRGVRLLVSLGGWGRSDGFVEATATPVAIDRFVRSTINLCDEFDLDGIDLDWEHPKNLEESAAYAALATALNRAFAPKGWLVTSAIADWQELPADFFRDIDRIHLMSYDNPGRHSTYEDAVTAMDRLLARGLPPAKLVLGVPFYGRQVDAPRESKSYAELARTHVLGPAEDETNGFYFNGPQALTRKARLVRSRGLAGIMIWELSQDTTPAVLLPAIRSGLKPEPNEK